MLTGVCGPCINIGTTMEAIIIENMTMFLKTKDKTFLMFIKTTTKK
jgi:hypothetical protein